jgi:probable HAF family extracellular repeat protein
MNMRVWLLALLMVLVGVVTAEPGSAQAQFTPLGVPGSIVTGISGNGKIVVGGVTVIGPFGYYFRWTALGGLIPIGAGPGGKISISRDGSTITADTTNDEQLGTAGIWLGLPRFYSIGGLPGGMPGGVNDRFLSNNFGVSGDGSIVVGLGWINPGRAHAFRWDQSTGMVDLGSLDGKDSRANAISADGTTIVGWDAAPNGYWRGAVWRNGKEMLLDPSGLLGEAYAVNADGTVIVGTRYGGGSHAYLWTVSGVTDLGILNRHGPNSNAEAAFATAVSDDGKVVVGFSGFGGERDAFIWTPSTGMVKLKECLQSKGATGLTGWILSAATAISGDGKVITGWGVSPRRVFESWVATLP